MNTPQRTVLIVEDTQTDQETLKRVLEANDLAVTIASDAEQATEKLQQCVSPNLRLIVVDLQIPPKPSSAPVPGEGIRWVNDISKLDWFRPQAPGVAVLFTTAYLPPDMEEQYAFVPRFLAVEFIDKAELTQRTLRRRVNVWENWRQDSHR